MRNQTRSILFTLALLSCTSLSIAANQLPAPLLGVTYNGLHETTNPTPAKVGEELGEIGQHFDYVRTYYPQYAGSVNLAALAKSKVKLLVGLYMFDKPDQQWTSDNYRDFIAKPLKDGDQTIIGILVGNENVAKQAEIDTWVTKIKAEFPTVPVSTAQKNADWLGSFGAALGEKVDFIAVNIYPAWCWNSNNAGGAPAASCGSSTPMTPDDAFNSFVAQFNEVQNKYPNKQIVVTETGYPTNYGKNAGSGSEKARSYACQYMQKVSNWANGANGGKKQVVFVYEMFNSVEAVDSSSAFNYNFGIKGKFPLPSFKQNSFPNLDCPRS